MTRRILLGRIAAVVILLAAIASTSLLLGAIALLGWVGNLTLTVTPTGHKWTGAWDR